VVGHELVSVVPLRMHCAGLRGERRNDDVKATREQRLIDYCVASDSIGAEDPRFPGSDRLRHDDGEASEAPLARRCFIIAVLALDEARAATIGVSLLFPEPEIRAFEAVIKDLMNSFKSFAPICRWCSHRLYTSLDCEWIGERTMISVNGATAVCGYSC